MTLAVQLTDYIRAAFSGLYIETFEPDEALREIQDLCREQTWQCAVWDIDCGLAVPGQVSSSPGAIDPLAAIHSLPAMATADGTVLLVLKNFHRFLHSAEIIQALQNQLLVGKTARTFIIVLAPSVSLPPELQRQFVILQHDLPSRDQLRTIACELVAGDPQSLPIEAHWPSLLDAASGLTSLEAESAMALSLARHGELRPEAIWEIKAQSLKKQNLLSLSRGTGTFSQLGGMEALKDFCRRALRPGTRLKGRGALLLSPPGCGKSQFCKALGNEVGRPVLSLDIGKMMGSLVGESERNIRQALQVAEALAPSILFVDEIEKGLSGVNGAGDSGVSTRLFGTLLTWLADHESDVFFIGTANCIRHLPPEVLRAERLDGIFFIDLPSEEQRRGIWSLYRNQYALDKSEPNPVDDGFTPAEIRSACRLSALLNISLAEAARNVIPVSITSEEHVDQLRSWASGRCLSAEFSGVYQKQAANVPRRKVSTKLSNN